MASSMLKYSPISPPEIQSFDKKTAWRNIHGASLSLALTSHLKQAKQPILVIAQNSSQTEKILRELEFFKDENSLPIIHFPDWETLPYDHFSPHQDIISERLSALHKIPQLESGIIVTSATTIMHHLSPVEFLSGRVFLIKKGDTINIDRMRIAIEKAGYRCVEQVREHGEFAVRGSIIDLFPMGSNQPFRIDLFDDEVDSIRLFSVETQRTEEKVDEISLLPAKEFPTDSASIETFRQKYREIFHGNPINSTIYQEVTDGIFPPGIEYYLSLFFEDTNSLLDYLPENSVVFTIGDINNKAIEFKNELEERYEQLKHDIQRPILPPNKIYLTVDQFFGKIKNFTNIKVLDKDQDYNKTIINFNSSKPLDLTVNYKAKNPLELFNKYYKDYTGKILFCAESAGRRETLIQLLNSNDIYPKTIASFQDFLKEKTGIAITVAPIDEGLILEDPAIALIAESQFFGARIMQRRRRKSSNQDVDAIIKDLTELTINSPVVHINHGVGRYLGLKALNLSGQTEEFLHLEYASGDKLYVPHTSLHLISRYTGGDVESAPLHRLGTDKWSKAKKKAEAQLKDVAAELLELYAKRESNKGLKFSNFNGEYKAFAEKFPFEETEDQLQAIDHVIQDLRSQKPMDRLICGDVGFGKTEVAMRAAFLAVQNNMQVAVLVPTTLLAEQHLQTFKDRFADWPINIESLSRFKSAKNQKQSIDKLKDGKVDIIIGTHKLLQPDIKYQYLGLVIIDEEHRFGVSQKEKLKSLRSNIHILNLTATPIPRTLNMAFAGIRDLSIIATPPKRRLSVKTFVHEHKNLLVKEAILREILRGGQAYFLHNDVKTIEKTAREIEDLIPEAKVAVAHGQMRETELEQIMADFYHRKFNVLVCTTIIESGIDIPSANTILINRADKFGISALHQLRGRVGRSHHQAYAYLFVPNKKILTKDAAKRLEAFSAYDDLGVGFTLATHDLEIRGAGEVLGKNQSGNMHEIGYTLYMDLLSSAVKSLKSGEDISAGINKANPTTIELNVPSLIPEIYLHDVNLRLQFYKKISSAKNQEELDEIKIEMIDRFGLLPEQTKTLFEITQLKLDVARLGVIKLEANSKRGKITFSEKPNIDPLVIIKLIQTESYIFSLEGADKLKFNLEKHEVTQRIKHVKDILAYLT